VNLTHHDLLKMYSAVAFEDKQLPFRHRLAEFSGSVSMPIRAVTFWGDGWGLNFNVGGARAIHPINRELTIVGDVHLHGSREKFEEDYILAKCSLP
jgi:hypothetical protein